MPVIRIELGETAVGLWCAVITCDEQHRGVAASALDPEEALAAAVREWRFATVLRREFRKRMN